jgi:exodeoxyribonuclease V alpha subunit
VKPSDILCLSPFNVGDEGSYRINNAIQAEVNPPKPNEIHLDRKVDKDRTTISFRVGDKLLNKKNDYHALPLDSWKEIEDSCGMLSSDDVPSTSVFNGQDGVIRELDDKKLVAQFDEELIVFDKAKLQNLLLAYCISVHSSQGSEAKYVLNVVSPTHKRMLNRNLLYVADTRSKIMQIDIGDMATYNDALLVDGNKERLTWLKELMEKDGDNDGEKTD